MSPIVTVAGGAAQALKRGRVPAVQALSWDRPNGGVGVLGPGEHAPDWAGKTIYPEESYAVDLPINTGANAAGFEMYRSPSSGEDLRYEYPTVATPLGTKRVFRMYYPGSTHTIDAVDEVAAGGGYYSWGVKISGTFTGTLVFEISDNGGASWSSVSLARINSNGSWNGTLASSTTSATAWVSQDGAATSGRQFRVRASAWTSGTATINIGFRAASSPAVGQAGTFTGNPTKVYTRFLMRYSPDFTHNGNANTKFVFFEQVGAANHHFDIINRGSPSNVAQPWLVPQNTPTQGYQGTAGDSAFEWMDVEWELQTGTPGNYDSIGRCWVNGTQLLNVTNARYFLADMTAQFTRLQLDPTYGGGFFPPPANIYFEIANWYRESAP